jgi:hypothetical protein
MDLGLFFSRSFGEIFLNFARLLSMTIRQTYQNFKKFYKTDFL